MTVPKRLRALDEACTIIRSMCTQDTTTFEGRHYRVREAFGSPKPVQKPHPPIMIGGTGEKVLLKIVAKHADMWNTSGPAELMAQKIAIIHRHGETVRRDTSKIEMTVMMPLCYRNADREGFVQGLIAGMRGTTPEVARKQIMIGDKQECLDTIDRYRKVGVTHFIFMTFAPYNVDEMQAFAEEVIPAAKR